MTAKNTVDEMKGYCGIDGVRHTLAKVILPSSSLAIRTQDLSWRCIFSRRFGSERGLNRERRDPGARRCGGLSLRFGQQNGIRRRA